MWQKYCNNNSLSEETLGVLVRYWASFGVQVAPFRGTRSTSEDVSERPKHQKNQRLKIDDRPAGSVEIRLNLARA